MNNSKFVKEITVIDPDTKGEVEISIYKHQNGGMFGVDSSYVEHIDNGEENLTVPDVFNPFQRVIISE